MEIPPQFLTRFQELKSTVVSYHQTIRKGENVTISRFDQGNAKKVLLTVSQDATRITLLHFGIVSKLRNRTLTI